MKVFFYSAIVDKLLFERVGFYRDDIEALKLGGAQVIASNSLMKLMRFRPQMIVSYFYTKSIFPAILGRLIGARIILTGGADQISPVLFFGYSLLVHRVFAFICLIFSHRILLSCTDDLVNFKKLCLGVRILENKIELVNHVVIPTPIPRISFNNHCHGKFDAFTICWMGSESNVRRKGVDRAVRLIGLLNKIGINANLYIAGSDGPGRYMIENIIKELDLSEHIQLLGPITEYEKNTRMANGSVYLQLSEHEGFGVAAAEAFFSGMIVVHSNRGGLRDVIGNRGLILDLSVIDENNVKEAMIFYSNFLRFKTDRKYLMRNIANYSIKSRSNAFYR